MRLGRRRALVCSESSEVQFTPAASASERCAQCQGRHPVVNLREALAQGMVDTQEGIWAFRPEALLAEVMEASRAKGGA